MPKIQSRSQSSTGIQAQPQTPDVNFKISDHAIIKSTHPLFPGLSCTITALPSPDAAIVEFEDGTRQHLLLEYLKQTQQPSSSLSDQQSISADNLSNLPLSSQNSHSQTSDFEISDALSPDEERERHRLELKVERAFYEAGCALRDLRERRLYRSTHKTFEEYCKQRFGFTRQSASLKILAAEVIDDLTTNGCQILPTSERQVRPIIQAKLQPEQKRTCWQTAIDIADGKIPTSKIVKEVVERLKAKPLYLASDYCELGEVFFLQRLKDTDRKYNGCWAIAIEVENRFTVKAAIYKGALEVRQENIQRIDCEQAQAEIRDIHQRLTQLTKYQLDPIDEAQIEILCRRAWFTDRQKQALSAMEEVYQLKVKP